MTSDARRAAQGSQSCSAATATGSLRHELRVVTPPFFALGLSIQSNHHWNDAFELHRPAYAPVTANPTYFNSPIPSSVEQEVTVLLRQRRPRAFEIDAKLTIESVK